MAPHTQMTTDARRPGRPLDLEKREAILQATRSLMADHGFDFSMDDVARRAAVSRQTVYNVHPSKEALLAAIFEDVINQIARPIDTVVDGETLAQTLTRFALDYLGMLTQPERIAALRAIVSPASISKGFGETIYRLGPLTLRERLAAYLERALPEAGLLSPNVALSADLFLSMVAGTLQLRAMLGVGEPAVLGSARERVDMAVSMFLQGLPKAASKQS